MDILRIATAGSVDDGKSTLIGRLLYETNALKKDQLEHIENKSRAKGFDYLDFSLATDGLLTERAQGITIDVSNIFFSTPNRRFIIADAPGHIEYTRNMVTGASNAHAAIILLDARKGVVEQTKRHFFITQLLGIKQIVFTVNKMDLVQYDAQRFFEIQKELETLVDSSTENNLKVFYVPLSALKGDGIVQLSNNMDWYEGPTLLSVIEKLSSENPKHDTNVLQVQYVIRPQKEAFHDYRGFAGKVQSGQLCVGDIVHTYPTKQSSRIKRIERYGEAVEQLSQGENGSILLEDEIDLSRGSVLVGDQNTITESRSLKAQLCWLQNETLHPGKRYWLQLGIQKTLVKVQQIDSKINLSTFEFESSQKLELNDIGTVVIQTASAVVFKSYQSNNKLGAFILIDEHTNNTAGVGFIQTS